MLPSFLPLSSPRHFILLFRAGFFLFLRVPQLAKTFLFLSTQLNWQQNNEQWEKMTTDIQKNVVYFGTRWRKCNADLLLMSVILWTLMTCAHHVSCVLDFSMKMNNMWASLCCYNSLHSSRKRFPKDFNNLAAEMCSSCGGVRSFGEVGR